MTAVISRPASYLRRIELAAVWLDVCFGMHAVAASCCSKANVRMLISHVEPGRGRTAARDTADVQTASGIVSASRIFDPICPISIAKRLFSNSLSAAGHLPHHRRRSEKPRCRRAIKCALLQNVSAEAARSTRGFISATLMPQR